MPGNHDALCMTARGMPDRSRFDEARRLAINGEWERLLWVRDRELVVLGSRRAGIESGVAQFYRSSAYAYFVGSFLGAILLATTACERLLRVVTQADESLELGPLIDLAKGLGKISKPMATRLHRLRRTIRRPVAHGKTQLFIGALGMEETNQFTWRASRNGSPLTVQSAAQEAIEAFLTLIADLYDREPVR